MMFLDCPAYLDQDGAVRCELPAEVSCWFTMRSTDGPIESAMIRCPAAHYFCGTIESLTWDGPAVAVMLWPGIAALSRGERRPPGTPWFPIALLATARRDGGPRLHPFCPVLAAGRLFAAIPPAPVSTAAGQGFAVSGRIIRPIGVRSLDGAPGRCGHGGRWRSRS